MKDINAASSDKHMIFIGIALDNRVDEQNKYIWILFQRNDFQCIAFYALQFCFHLFFSYKLIFKWKYIFVRALGK